MIRNFKAPNIIELDDTIKKTIFLGGSIEENAVRILGYL